MLHHLMVPLVVSTACATSPLSAVGDDDHVVAYEVSFPAPQTQMVEITVDFPGGGEDTLDVMLPVWRPGRYSILDPSATVRNVHAISDTGAALPVTKVDKSSWRVTIGGSGAAGQRAARARVSYSVYANSIRDRTRHVDATHAFLSGSAVFMYARRFRSAPVRVVVDAPDEWRIAGGLELAPGEERVLVAANYDVLADSPLEIGLHDSHSFDVDGVPHEIVVWPPGVEYDVARMTEDFTAIVRAQKAVFESTPYERYVFLIHAGAGAGGGTEHLNSTIMQVSRAALEDSLEGGGSYERMLGLVSHEMFHTWNVKQLRPAGIHPYDYQKENYTDLLWVAEGGTSYYGGLTLVRAELRKEKKYIDGLARSIDALSRHPGARVQSLAASSFDAWISRGSSDSVTSAISFYGKGELAFLAIDMEVRRRSQGEASLDDVMRTLYARFPLSGTGFTTADMVDTLGELTGSSFDDFFARHIAGTEPLPLAEGLLSVGLELRFRETPEEEEEEGEESQGTEGEQEAGDGEEKASEPVEAAQPASGEPRLEPYLGLRLRGGGSGSLVSAVLSNGPAYPAGVLPGDEVIALDGRRLRSGDLDERLKRKEPGDAIELVLLRRDELLTIEVVLTGIPDGKWVIERLEEPTDAQKAEYESWIGRPWPGKKRVEDEN